MTVAYSDFSVQQIRITPLLWALIWVPGGGNVYVYSTSRPNYPGFLQQLEMLH